MSFLNRRREQLQNENLPKMVIVEKTEKPKAELIIELPKEPATPVNTIIEETPVVKKRVYNINPIKKSPKKRAQESIRSLEVNKNNELNGNIPVAWTFKSICKKHGLKINKTLHEILSKWNEENAEKLTFKLKSK